MRLLPSPSCRASLGLLHCSIFSILSPFLFAQFRIELSRRDPHMGKSRNKEVGNPSAISEQPLPEKKKVKALKAAKKIAKKISKGISEISEKINTEDSKAVSEIAIKVDGSTQVNEQREANAKETEVNTKETIGGLIFMCNGRTKSDCFHYKVLGLPENKREFVFQVKPGMRLFLYDFDLKLLHGIFKASSNGGMNLEPAAFNGSYPAQVRFEIERACIPLPHHIFKHAIKENYTGVRNMFKIELSIEQVKELTILFPSVHPEQPVANKDALVPKPVQVPPPAPTPAVILWPAVVPFVGPAPSQREIAQAPIRTAPLDPRSSNAQEFRNLGSNPNPFLVPRAAPDFYTHSYRSAGPLETNINYLKNNDPYQMRLDNVDLGPLQPAPHVRLPPYDAPRISDFELGASSYFGLGGTRPAPAPSTLSGYSTRNSMPVSSRYSFAGPLMPYRRGHEF